jgi:hypothetical protein
MAVRHLDEPVFFRFIQRDREKRIGIRYNLHAYNCTSPQVGVNVNLNNCNEGRLSRAAGQSYP